MFRRLHDVYRHGIASNGLFVEIRARLHQFIPKARQPDKPAGVLVTGFIDPNDAWKDAPNTVHNVWSRQIASMSYSSCSGAGQDFAGKRRPSSGDADTITGISWNRRVPVNRSHYLCIPQNRSNALSLTRFHTFYHDPWSLLFQGSQ